MAYKIEFDPGALKDLKKLDRPIQQRLLGFLKMRVGTLENPREIGEALSGATLGHYWKYRFGDWRIICDIQDSRIVVRVLVTRHGAETAVLVPVDHGRRLEAVARLSLKQLLLSDDARGELLTPARGAAQRRTLTAAR